MSEWNVRVLRKAQKSIEKLPKEIRRRVAGFITDTERFGPFPENWWVEHLHGSLSDLLKVKFGNYRILYSYEPDSMTVYINKAGHRKDIYRRSS